MQDSEKYLIDKEYWMKRIEHLPVELDGIPAGLTPITLPDIPVGIHQVSIEGKEGVMERSIEVNPNSISLITYSPEKSGVLIETKGSLLLENSNPILTLILSNFITVINIKFGNIMQMLLRKLSLVSLLLIMLKSSYVS